MADLRGLSAFRYSGTIRATTQVANTVHYGGLPFVTIITDPPDLTTGVGGNIIGSQRGIQFGVPLCSNLGEFCGKVIEAGQNSFTRTNRTPLSPNGARDRRCFPFVAQIADPPHMFYRVGSNIARGKGTVFGGVPLRNQMRVCGCQIVIIGLLSTTSAFRTPRAGGSVLDGGLPLVTLGTLPPNPFFTAF